MSSNEKVVSFFHRHLVPIYFSCKSENDSHSFIVTAFVLSVGNQWFLVTAGHCIKDIEKLISDLGYQITQCRLIDSMGLGARHREPIPFDYWGGCPACLSEERQFDYGVIQLSTYYKRLLEVNGVVPLSEEVWKKQPTVVAFYMLLGVPFQLTKVDADSICITTTLHSVERLNDKPSNFPQTDVPLFYGRIKLDESISDISGMSGGPIFAFHQNDKKELLYWLVALQSRWLPQSRILIASPTNLLGRFLEEVAQENRESDH